MASTDSYPTTDYTDIVLENRYKLTHKLGKGTFGVVYHAIDRAIRTDDDSSRSVAVKIINKRHPKYRDRLEVYIHKRASLLPNVVKLHNSYDYDEYSVLVMDLCGGGSLQKRIDEKKGRPLFTDTRQLKTLFLRLVDAVGDLHRAGIYHRDLKPSNILLSDDGTEAFLADFGLATRNDRYGDRCGTREYMMPELDPKKFDGRASCEQGDVWALGVILINMASGCIPWASAFSTDRAYAEFVRDPRYLVDSFGLSPGLNRIIRRMLRAKPALRMSLPQVRKEIAELDESFFCGPTVAEEGINAVGRTAVNCNGPVEDAPIVPERADAGSTMQSEMRLLRLDEERREAWRQQQQRQAEFRYKKLNRDVSGNSSLCSTCFAETEDSDVETRKWEIGGMMKALVLKAKKKLRFS